MVREVNMTRRLLLLLCSHLVIRNLNFVGSGRKGGNAEDGIRIPDAQDLEVDQVEISSP